MAIYNKDYKVDLIKQNWIFGDDCEGMASVYPNGGLEDLFTKEKAFEENVYIYLNLYYTDNLEFKSLQLEISGVETEVVCTDKEKEMFANLLKKEFA